MQAKFSAGNDCLRFAQVTGGNLPAEIYLRLSNLPTKSDQTVLKADNKNFGWKFVTSSRTEAAKDS